MEEVEGRKGYPHSTERSRRRGGTMKDREIRRWKKEPFLPQHLTIYDP